MASAGNGQSSSTSTPAWVRWGVAAVIGIGALMHLPFVVRGYGETDAALTGIVATLWSQDGRLPMESGIFVERRFRSNPLYVYILEELLSGGVIGRDQVAWFMNVLTAVCGVLLPVVVFLVVRRLTSSAEAAGAALLVLVAPVVFHSNCIGFPTIPSLLAFGVALLAFQRAVPGKRLWHGWAALSGALLILAVLGKVDVVLLAPCFLVAALHGGRLRERKAFVVLACVLPVVSVLCWHVFCRAAAPVVPDTVTTFQSWSKQWPIQANCLLLRPNVINMAMAPGVGTSVVFVAALLACLIRKPWRPAGLAVLLCILPTVLFWGFREINSSRHNLWIVVPAAALVAFVLHRLVRPVWLRAALVVAIGMSNYLIGPRIPTQFTASAHWFAAAMGRNREIARVQQDFALAVRQPVVNGKLCFYQNVGGPWIAAMAVANSDRTGIKRSGSRQSVWHIDLTQDGRAKTIWIPDARDQSKRTWNKIHREGWTAIIHRPGAPPFLQVLPNAKLAPWPRVRR